MGRRLALTSTVTVAVGFCAKAVAQRTSVRIDDLKQAAQFIRHDCGGVTSMRQSAKSRARRSKVLVAAIRGRRPNFRYPELARSNGRIDEIRLSLNSRGAAEGCSHG